jgi:hypothetical protein
VERCLACEAEGSPLLGSAAFPQPQAEAGREELLLLRDLFG